MRDRVEAVALPKCSVSLPLSELQTYLDALPRLLTEELTLFVSGSWTGTVSVQDFYGSGKLYIRGTDGAALTGSIRFTNVSVPAELYDLNVIADDSLPTENGLVHAVASKRLWVQNCKLTGNSVCSGVHCYVRSEVVCADLTIQDCGTAVFCSANAKAAVFSNAPANEKAYSGNAIGAYVHRGGIILLGECTPALLGGGSNRKNGGLIAKWDGTLL